MNQPDRDISREREENARTGCSTSSQLHHILTRVQTKCALLSASSRVLAHEGPHEVSLQLYETRSPTARRAASGRTN